MATITDLETTTTGADSRGIINTNFDNLNTDKAEISGQTMTGQIDWSQTNSFGLKIQSLTTTQRDLLSPANGHIIYNTTTTQFEIYEAGVWQSLRASAVDASTTAKGITKLSTAPAVASNPIAVGDNDSRVLSADDATLVGAITADATEINQLDGAIISAAQLTEAGTFFGSTDISGAEAETLTDTSDASALHNHDSQIADGGKLTNMLFPVSYNAGFDVISVTNTTYTVPTGKTFIITCLRGAGITLQIDNAAGTPLTVYSGSIANGAASNYLNQPFYARADAEVIVNVGAWAHGYLVNEGSTYTPVCEQISSGATYTVPADTILVITNCYDTGNNNSIISANNGTLINVNAMNYNATSSDFTLGIPMVFEAGDVVSMASGTVCTINGYLIDIS